VDSHNWYLSTNGRRRTSYAVTNFGPRGKKTRLNMHRTVLGNGSDALVDHINGNGLDNRKQNLRWASKSENGFNRFAPIQSATGYIGVKLGHGCRRRFEARIQIDGRMVHIGMFGDPETAARAYDREALRLRGPLTSLNFPNEIPTEAA
jgi:hypothetical protein